MNTLLKVTLIISGIYSTAAAQPPATRMKVNQSGFVENRGQVHDQYYKPNSSVRYVYTDGQSFNLQLKNNGFSYELFKVIPQQNGLPESGFGRYDPEEEDYIPSSVLSYRVDIKLKGANSNCEIVASNPTEALYNFYTTGDATKPIINVPQFSEVTYKNIYPNIDLVFASSFSDEGNKLEYHWIVRKGGNPSDITLSYEGAEGLIANDDGTISVLTPIGTITEGQLSSFCRQDNSPVKSSYLVKQNEINYRIAMPHNSDLVIDPNIVWASDYGGESDEFVSEGNIALDSKSNSLITGNTRSTLFIATVGAYQTVFGGGDYDAFLAKIQAKGKLVWSTYFGGPDKDEGHGVAVDQNDNVYLAGLTHSSSGISTPGSYRPNFSGNTDAYIAKFNTSGHLLWSTYYGGKADDQINSITCDAKGNLYFAGYSTSDTGIATTGAHQDTVNNSEIYGGDAIVGEFHSDGKLKWGSYLGGPLTDRAHAIGLGNKKELYIEGTVESDTEFASQNVQQSTYGGGPDDAFLARWDTTGKFYWCTYYGGEGDDHGRGVSVDQYGSIYILGWTDSDSTMGSAGAMQPKWFSAYGNDGSRLSDGYLAKFNSSGMRIWGTYFGGDGKDQLKGEVIDRVNHCVYGVGLTSSVTNIASPGAYQETYAGGTDADMVKLDFGGNRIWSTYIGSAGTDRFRGVQIDDSGFLYCLMEEVGHFYLTPGTNLTTYRGATDAVVLRFAPFDQCYDQYEPNETSTHARAITPYKDSTLYGYTASIATGSDQDWYKFQTTPGNNLKIELTDLSVDYNLNLYNSSGALVKSSANTGTTDEKIVYNNIPAGIYSLQIAHTSSVFDPVNCYRFKIMLKNTAWQKLSDDYSPDQAMGISDIVAHAALIDDHFDLNIASPFSSPALIELVSAFGQLVYSTPAMINEGSQTIQIPAGNLASGIYFIRIQTQMNANTVLKVPNIQ